MRWHYPLVLFVVSLASGQQAIINMPSADITPKGKHFLMHVTQTRAWQPARSWSGTNFYAYGTGHSTELAVTSYNGGSPLSKNFATGIGFKAAPQLWKQLRHSPGSGHQITHGFGITGPKFERFFSCVAQTVPTFGCSQLQQPDHGSCALTA